MALIGGGVSLDLSKAYNTLPRCVLEVINKRLGLGGFWSPYAAYLDGLQRHMVVQNNWGEGIKSVTGVPEGCPYAVIQMILITWVFTLAVHNDTGIELHSFVDDWVLADEDNHKVAKATSLVQKLTQKFGLILSLSKSAAFASSSKQSKLLTKVLESYDLHIPIVGNFEGLGVQFHAWGSFRTTARDTRLNKASRCLKRLQGLPWNASKKTAVIKRGLLPQAFYGCETQPFGKTVLGQFRAKANHAVWNSKQYHAHFLTPLFSGAHYEPNIYILQRRFRSWIRCRSLKFDEVDFLWDEILARWEQGAIPPRGPLTSFMQQLRDLQWTLHRGGKCSTATGWELQIWDLTVSQFDETIMESWEKFLQPKLAKLKTLHDIQSFSVLNSTSPKDDDAYTEAFHRKVRLGGLFSGHRKGMVDPCNASSCQLCGCFDDTYHRFRTCPETSDLRRAHGEEFLLNLPDAVLLGGIFPHLEAAESYAQALDSLPCQEITKLPDDGTTRIFFTDGAGSDLGHASTRLCAWAVTEAVANEHHNLLRESALLFGRRQTVYRAELTGAIAAMALSDSSVIFTDNAAVAAGMNKLLAGQDISYWLTHPDRDLWQVAHRLLQSKPRCDVTVKWTKAHRQMHTATSFEELWQIWHNGRADFEAGRTLREESDGELAFRRSLLHASVEEIQTVRTRAAGYLRAVLDRCNF